MFKKLSINFKSLIIQFRIMTKVYLLFLKTNYLTKTVQLIRFTQFKTFIANIKDFLLISSIKRPNKKSY